MAKESPEWTDEKLSMYILSLLREAPIPSADASDRTVRCSLFVVRRSESNYFLEVGNGGVDRA